jgi:Zn-dependent M32 family carboxypeptidase
MPPQTHDPRDIPILTESQGSAQAPLDFNAAHAAILTETLKLADSLLRQASRDIEATLFERVFDRLRAALPELVDHALRSHGSADKAPEKSPENRE